MKRGIATRYPGNVMSHRYMFTLGRRYIILYLCCSIITTLIVFRAFRKIIAYEEDIDEVGKEKLKVPVPDPKPDRDFSHGELRSFKEQPILTEIECEGDASYDRVCRMKNICYSPNSDRFFALTVDEKGLKRKWMKENDDRLLDLSAVDNHNVFYFEFDEDPGIALMEMERSNMLYMSVTKKTFIFSRFVYNNIMHNLHDDFIGQYLLHKKYSTKYSENNLIDKENYVFFADGFVENPNDHLLATLTHYPFIYRAALKKYDSKSPPICFENAIVGNSKDGIWYDYGFHDEPQGPIAKKPLTGKHVKDAADFLRAYYGIKIPNRSKIIDLLGKIKSRTRKDSHKISMDYCISIFSRTRDRLILNEQDLMKDLETNLGLPVKLVQLETLKFNEIILIMSKTVISIGLHGSALVFAMFMPHDSVLIEMFPYAIPGENYSPYRTLSWLPELDISYRMWVNKNATMNYSQIGLRKKIDSLTPEDYVSIISLKTVPPHICCGNLPWTVRIYQDTVVEPLEIKILIKEAIKESLGSRDKRRKKIAKMLEMSINRVKDVEYIINQQKSFTGNDKISMNQLVLKWENPWKNIESEPSQYGVWIEEMLEEVIVNSPAIKIETCPVGHSINVWIRPYRYDEMDKKNIPAAVFSKKFSFKC